MMIKNAVIFKFEDKFVRSLSDLDSLFADNALQPCLSSEMSSIGWVHPFRNGRYFVYGYGGLMFFKLGVEEKLLPKSAIDNAVDKRAALENITLDSRAKRKELEERVIAELMPRALTQRKSIFAYIDLEKQWLVVDASSANKASLVASFLRKTLGSLLIVPVSSSRSVKAALTSFAKSGLWGTPFHILDDIETKTLGEDGGQASIKGVPIDTDDVQRHIGDNWEVSKLSLQHQMRLSFSIGSDFIFKRLKLSDLANEDIDFDDEPFVYNMASALLIANQLQVLVSDFIEIIDKEN